MLAKCCCNKDDRDSLDSVEGIHSGVRSSSALVSNIIGPGKIVEDRLFLGVKMKK